MNARDMRVEPIVVEAAPAPPGWAHEMDGVIAAHFDAALTREEGDHSLGVADGGAA